MALEKCTVTRVVCFIDGVCQNVIMMTNAFTTGSSEFKEFVNRKCRGKDIWAGVKNVDSMQQCKKL